MTMDFYLPRDDQRALQRKLATVPHLVEELAVTITRQARIGRPGLAKLHRHKPESEVPFHIAAAEAHAGLHNALVTWVRFTCEHRQVRYTDSDDDITLSKWLYRHMTSLALTPGSEEAGDDIGAAIDECQRVIDLPPDDEVLIDRARVREANRQVLTAGQCERIAHRLGDLGVGLNKRRVETLARQGKIKPCGRDGEVKFYRLGDVLDAHFRRDDEKRKRA
ncbi:hypothetical protein PP713_13965 [Mycobacterium sp. CSUR Q5927]|nr:hypothetical protein [Mycobacterium sp. CSUR Q5927]